MADRIVVVESYRGLFPRPPQTLEAFLAAAPEVVREQRRTRIYRGPGGIFVKLYLFPGLERLAAIGRPSTAEREFESLCALSGTGLDVPAPIGYAVRTSLGLVTAAAIAEEAVEDAIDLREWAERTGALPRNGASRGRAEVLDALGRAMARLHAAELVYGRSGAHFRNILLRFEDGAPRLTFIDVPDARRVHGRALERGRLRDIGRLLVTIDRHLGAAARERFFAAYHAAAGTPIDRRLGFEEAAEHQRRVFANETVLAGIMCAMRRRFRRTFGFTSEVRRALPHGS